MTASSRPIVVFVIAAISIMLILYVVDPFLVAIWWMSAKALLGTVILALGVVWVAVRLIRHAWKDE